MRCSQILEKISETIEHYGDKEGYIDSDGVPVQIKEVIVYEPLDVEQRETMIIFR